MNLYILFRMDNNAHFVDTIILIDAYTLDDAMGRAGDCIFGIQVPELQTVPQSDRRTIELLRDLPRGQYIEKHILIDHISALRSQ